MPRTALIMSDKFGSYNFGKQHPLKPERVLLTWELIKGLKLNEHPNCIVMEPRLATDEEIELVHDKPYVDFVKRVEVALDQGPLPEDLEIEGLKYNLGPGDNPVFPKMHHGSAIVVGATIVAMEAVHDGIVENAFQAGGGLHHAMAGKAEGFCIYNDPAIAIKYILKKHAKEDLRIMYIDVDAHHGDGVQAAFYKDDVRNVMTVSFHESGKFLFPGTGFIEERGTGAHEGLSVNIPLLPYTYDDLYLDIFDDVIPKITKAFKPDIIVSQNGVDTHGTDPLAQLGLTTKGQREIFRRIHELASKYCHGKLVALGGGGYNISVVPRSWTMLFADLLGALDTLPEKIPADLLACLNAGRDTDLIPESFLDAGPTDDMKWRIGDYKFLDEFELYGLQMRYRINNEILPLIEKNAKK